MVAEVTKTYYRCGTSFARGTTIDAYLFIDEKEGIDDSKLLYEIWGKGQPDWPEWLVFPGNFMAITAEMILEVPEADFIAAFKAGSRGREATKLAEAAKRIYQRAREVT